MRNWILFTDTMINLDQVIMATKGEQRGVKDTGYYIRFLFAVPEDDSFGVPYTVDEYWPNAKSRDLAWEDIREAAGGAVDLDRHTQVGE